MWEGIKNESIIQGIDVELFWPKHESNFKYQESILKNEAKNFNALIFAPSNGDHVAPNLKELKNNKIEIVIIDSDLTLPPNAKRTDYYDSFIATDNELGGRLAALFALKHMTPASKVIVVGGFDLNKPRTLGFENELKKRNQNITS